jgi:ABC-type antimicrobial peptide transport system permease subunit
MEFTVRTAGAAGVASGIRRVLHALDAGVSSQEGVKTLEGSIADSLAPLRILGILMLIFGVVAMLLAALGVYVVLAHAVAQRTNEFGIRMALGARRADVLRLVLGQAWKLSAIGVGIGLAAAFVAVRVTASLLYGVIVFNAVIFVALALMMIAVALLAAYVPARRAIRVDPLLALRCD